MEQQPAESNKESVTNIKSSINLQKIIMENNKNNTTKIHIDGLTLMNAINNIDGGSIHAWNLDSLVITNAMFKNNTSNERGGAIFLGGGTGDLIINNSIFEDNFSNYAGGAIWIHTSEQDELKIKNSLFENNRVVYGNEIYGGGGAIKSQNQTIISNSS